MLGFDGFRVLDARVDRGELELLVRVHDGAGVVSGVRGA
jgi:hypothetical protein